MLMNTVYSFHCLLLILENSNVQYIAKCVLKSKIYKLSTLIELTTFSSLSSVRFGSRIRIQTVSIPNLS